ncbi:MAG TPA: phosphoethanolamine transferase [Telluria sp.]|nr:phosphoethanolamine transferase [Telluria sp.]
MTTTNPAAMPDAPATPNRSAASRWSFPIPGSSVVLATLSILVCSALIVVMGLSMHPTLKEWGTSLHDIVRWRYGEYLFFIGTTHIALLQLRRKNWIRAGLIFAAGVAWASFYGSSVYFLSNLGGDSLSEAQSFDIAEARFWLQTLNATINSSFEWSIMVYYMAAALATYFSLRFALRQKAITARYYSHVKYAVAALLVGVALYFTLSDVVKLFMENTAVYSGARNKFNNAAPVLASPSKGVDLMVYVGESTSAMNMGIYGYPRDTTPKLQKLKDTDRNLVVFNNVFSTHTHTSPSLMEALSFGVDRNEYYLPIEKRKRVSIVDLFVANGMRTVLFSSQGQTGTWSMASSIIFKHARSTYSTNTRFAGNNEYMIAKPWDGEFFQKHIGTAFAERDARPQVAFLHSYAGHGEYYEYVPPEFRKHLDDGFGMHREGAAAGAEGPLPGPVEDYDSTIRYIDHNVSQSIEWARRQSRPIVFVYFSDHGDAPYAGQAHDSSQFVHEMARVPFMIFFNDAARLRIPATYKKYRALAALGRDASLEQLSSTLLDLVNLRLKDGEARKVIEMPVIGEEVTHPPIVVRETSSGVTYVNINRKAAPAPAAAANAEDRSDAATRLYTAAGDTAKDAGRLCFRDVDSVEKLVRSRLVAGCIELTVGAKADGKPMVIDAAGNDTGIRMEDVLKVVSLNRMGLWIRAPQLRSGAQCNALTDYLGGNGAPAHPVMVEFPSGSHANAAELRSCSGRLGKLGVATSYQVPDAEASACARVLAEGGRFNAARSCSRLRKDLAAAKRSRMFTDIGFDHGAQSAMEAVKAARDFKWNTWNVAPESYAGAVSERYRMAVLKAEPPQE